MNSFYGTRDWFLRMSGRPFKNFIAGNNWLTNTKMFKTMNTNDLHIEVILRFKMFPFVVCDDNKTLWRLEDKTGKRYRPLRKLTYNESKKAFRISGVWITRKRLLNLKYRSIEKILIRRGETLPF